MTTETTPPVEPTTPPAEPAPTPAPEGGITPGAVAGQTEPTAPDASIIADQYNQRAAAEATERQRRAEQAERDRLQQELDALRALKNGTAPPAEPKADKSGLPPEVQQQIEQIQKRQEQWDAQMRAQAEKAEVEALQDQVTTWVQGEEETYPLINTIGQQAIVFQKMWNSRNAQGQMMSEAVAAREVEADLKAIVEQCAPKLGFVRGNVSQEGNEQPVSINSTMNITNPADRDDLSDDQRLEYLIRQAQGQ